MSLAIVVVVLASCGGARAARQVTVEAIARSTQSSKSARISGTLKFDNGSSTFSGDADFVNGRYRMSEQIRGAGAAFVGPSLELMAIGNHVFIRGTRGYVFPADWCQADNADSRNPFGFDPSAVLTSLRPPATLQRLGTETIRFVTTTHYRVLHGQWDEIWVDADDHLRRIVGQRGTTDPRSRKTVTVEFYDFGATATPITAPSTPKPCF